MAAPALTYAVMAPLMLFAVYRRLRRNFGQQPLLTGRLWARVCLLGLVAAVLLAAAWFTPAIGLGGAAGLCVGAVLALYGLRLTQFETTPQGRFYTPHRMIGVALTMLLLGRLVYRFVVLSTAGAGTAFQDPNAAAAMQRSPLTFAIAGLLVGYYLAYSGGLLRRARTSATA